MSKAFTRSFDWMIPSFVGAWMFKRLYLIEKPNINWKKRIPLAALPIVSPIVGCYTMYVIYYRNDDRIRQLIHKYPAGTNFHARDKVNPFQLGRKLQEQKAEQAKNKSYKLNETENT